jgi:hypothetical protein
MDAESLFDVEQLARSITPVRARLEADLSPNGDKLSQPEAAQLLNVSDRSVSRAKQVLKKPHRKQSPQLNPASYLFLWQRICADDKEALSSIAKATKGSRARPLVIRMPLKRMR